MLELEDPLSGLAALSRLQMVAFEAELAHQPRSLVAGLWEAVDLVCAEGHSQPAQGTSVQQRLVRCTADYSGGACGQPVASAV